MNITFEYYPGGKKKALTMSYDDGQIYDRRLVEIFNQYGIKATFHLNSGTIDSQGFLKSSEINLLFQGHEVSVHSVTHPTLTKLPTDVLLDEIREDRRRLEQLVGYPIRGMSYPYGIYDQQVLKVLPSLGIEYARTVNSHHHFDIPYEFLTWHPTCHHDQNLLNKCNEFQNIKQKNKMSLFYVWGHSYEFNNNNNWELIEKFCKLVSHDESVWYATNIEIFDYIKALRNLKFNVDCTVVYNPSALSVWIGVEGKPLEIAPGKTINL